jgi:hypothetical protein
MIVEIKKVVSDNILAYRPKGSKCITYTGIEAVACALGISFDAAREIVRDWLSEELR